jgi:hypothetical protein
MIVSPERRCAEIAMATIAIPLYYPAGSSHASPRHAKHERQRVYVNNLKELPMSIFGKIKDAIFGKKAQAAPVEAAPAAAPAATQAAPAAPAPISEVDVEANLAALAQGKDLNWRTSIVDLMKLLGIDSSYENRKELAQELGNTGYSGSAEDNIQLHKQVMQELARNGGKVPADLLD